MGLDYVDVFYHHRPDPDTPLEETMGALASIVKSGKALYAGISQYQPEDTRKAAATLKSMGVPLLIHQPVYSMLNRWIEDGLLDALAEVGAGCICFSPLAQGLLSDKYLDGIPDDSRAARNHFLPRSRVTPDLVERLNKLNAIAKRRGQSLAQLALVWVLRHKGVTSALIGARTVAQLDDSLDALKTPELSADEIAEIDRVLA
jgi:L-glyceraldehyde 3-phosphate reductase